MKITLEIISCSKHNFKAIALSHINEETQWGSGRRLAGGKCCGSWDITEQSWELDRDDLEDMRDEVNMLLTQLGETNDKNTA